MTMDGHRANIQDLMFSVLRLSTSAKVRYPLVGSFIPRKKIIVFLSLILGQYLFLSFLQRDNASDD